MKLIYDKCGHQVAAGDIVYVNGQRYILDSIEKPRSPASTGRVHLHEDDEFKAKVSWFPSVISAVWIEREDHV